MTVFNRHHEETISVFGAFKDARQQHTLHATTAIGWKKRRQQKINHSGKTFIIGFLFERVRARDPSTFAFVSRIISFISTWHETSFNHS